MAMQAMGEYTKKVRGHLTDAQRISSARNDNVELGGYTVLEFPLSFRVGSGTQEHIPLHARS